MKKKIKFKFKPNQLKRKQKNIGQEQETKNAPTLLKKVI
jgi:hypothetical protein